MRCGRHSRDDAFVLIYFVSPRVLSEERRKKKTEEAEVTGMIETEHWADPIMRSRHIYVYIRETIGMDTEHVKSVSVYAGGQPHD